MGVGSHQLSLSPDVNYAESGMQGMLGSGLFIVVGYMCLLPGADLCYDDSDCCCYDMTS